MTGFLFAGFSTLSVIFLVLGFILIGIELFMPGFTLPGILGCICLIAFVLVTATNVEEALIMIIALLSVLGILFAIILFFFGKGNLPKPLVLTEAQKKENGYISSADLDYLLGQRGFTTTDLRPVGSAEFHGVKFNVVSDGEFIRKGTEVEIIKVEGSKLIVKIKK